MNFEILKIAIGALGANKIRAFLTIFSIIVGSACMALVITVSLLGREYIIAQIEGVGSNIVYGELSRAGLQVAQSDEISLADLDALRHQAPDVRRVAGSHGLQMTVVAGNVDHAVTLVAVTPEIQAIRNFVILRGRFFDEADIASHGKVCLLTEDLAEAAFPGTNPIGQDVRVGELRFVVIGVFKERVATFGEWEITRESVIVPFGLLKSYAGTDVVRVLYAQAVSSDAVPAVTREVEQVLRSRHRAGAVYNIQNLSAILDAARKISFAASVVLLAVGLITLIVGGVGIMNIMLVTVSERTREIGIRKAVGAHEWQILCQFLLEALIISGSGSTIGIAIALGIPLVIRRFLPANVNIPVSAAAVGLAFAVSCATGIVFGYLPARRAAKLQAVEALHYE